MNPAPSGFPGPGSEPEGGIGDSVDGADSYVVVRDGKDRIQLRAEGSRKEWTDVALP